MNHTDPIDDVAVDADRALALVFPVMDATASLTALQQHAEPPAQGVAWNWRAPPSLHLTLYYFGVPRRLYGEISNPPRVGQTARPSPGDPPAGDRCAPPFHEFHRALRSIVTDALRGSPRSWAMTVQRLETFSQPRRTLLVARVPAAAAVIALRREILTRFHALLADCGVDDPQHFVGHSPTIGAHAGGFAPHVTLAAASTARIGDIPSPYELGVHNVRLRFGGLEIHAPYRAH